ncbi:MAG: hypothetical protein Tsb009_03770 [Planctomycetaceae bacterium]
MSDKTLPCASDFMNVHVHCVSMKMPLAEVIHTLDRYKISDVPVVDETQGERHLVGLLSEQDCLAALANEVFFGMPATPQTAETMMRRHPVSVSADTDLFALASIFVSHGYRQLPVVSGETLLGVVSRRDILHALNEYYMKRQAEQERIHHPPDLKDIFSHRFLVSGN